MKHWFQRMYDRFTGQQAFRVLYADGERTYRSNYATAKSYAEMFPSRGIIWQRFGSDVEVFIPTPKGPPHE